MFGAGAWGIALLASYMVHKSEGEGLDKFLEEKVFAGEAGSTLDPDPADVAGFEAFFQNAYSAGLPIEKAAVECLK